MLPLKYLFENFELAKECLQYYDHSEDHLDEMLNYYRISANAIYPFYNLDHQVCFLRLAPVEEKEIEEVLDEIKLIQYLLDHQFPANIPYPMKDKKLVEIIDTKWGNYTVSCFIQVPGKSIEDQEVSLQIVYDYGVLLARFHQLTKLYPTKLHRNNERSLLQKIHFIFEQNEIPESIKSLLERTIEDVTSLPKNSSNYGIVHYDFEADNVFYDSKKNSFHVIDFDDMMYCFYTLDLVQVIEHMDEVVEDSLVGEATDAFLKGYQSIKPLTKEELNSFEIMKHIVYLQEYSTIIHVLQDELEDEPDRMKEIRHSLQNRLNEIERSIK